MLRDAIARSDLLRTVPVTIFEDDAAERAVALFHVMDPSEAEMALNELSMYLGIGSDELPQCGTVALLPLSALRPSQESMENVIERVELLQPALENELTNGESSVDEAGKWDAAVGTIGVMAPASSTDEQAAAEQLRLAVELGQAPPGAMRGDISGLSRDLAASVRGANASDLPAEPDALRKQPTPSQELDFGPDDAGFDSGPGAPQGDESAANQILRTDTHEDRDAEGGSEAVATGTDASGGTEQRVGGITGGSGSGAEAGEGGNDGVRRTVSATGDGAGAAH